MGFRDEGSGYGWLAFWVSSIFGYRDLRAWGVGVQRDLT